MCYYVDISATQWELDVLLLERLDNIAATIYGAGSQAEDHRSKGNGVIINQVGSREKTKVKVFHDHVVRIFFDSMVGFVEYEESNISTHVDITMA